MANQGYHIGMIGLGVMGRNLLGNMADHGFSVAGYDKDPQKVAALSDEAKGKTVYAASKIEDFVNSLEKPRIIMMLVPAGGPVDSVIAEVFPLMFSGDILIDGGNSHFTDTELRAKKLAVKKVMFLGTGVSGGEAGARHGPSIMPGGPKQAYERVRHIFEAVAAKVDDKPCVTYIGPGASGHYVKMVHNGIEYALLQLIAETYDLMKRGLGFTDDQLGETYRCWNEGQLNSFLIEITAEIFKKIDEKTAKPLIDEVLDVARQKGTGTWTSEDAMKLNIPVPNINTAVEMRNISCYRWLRQTESHLLGGPAMEYKGDANQLAAAIGEALCAAMVISYSQGFALLAEASRQYNYNLNLADIAGIWRGGCIIRSSILEKIMAAYRDEPRLLHLLANRQIAQGLSTMQESLRLTAKTAAELGIPVPGLMAAIAYFDSLRSPWLPANLIAAQRDFFGSHTYERIDEKGTFHTEWSKERGQDARDTKKEA